MSLEDLLDMDAEPWKPDAGDKVVGKLVKVSYIESGKFGPYPLYELHTEDGRLVEVHAFHTVLKDELHRQNVTEGDTLGLKYLGIPEGKSYELYRVIVERGDGRRRPQGEAPEQTEPLRFEDGVGEATKARIISELGAVAPAITGGMDEVKKRWREAGLPSVENLEDRHVEATDLFIAGLVNEAGLPF